MLVRSQPFRQRAVQRREIRIHSLSTIVTLSPFSRVHSLAWCIRLLFASPDFMFHVPDFRSLSICDRLQGMSREHSCARGDDAWFMDRRRTSALRPTAPFLATSCTPLNSISSSHFVATLYRIPCILERRNTRLSYTISC